MTINNFKMRSGTLLAIIMLTSVELPPGTPSSSVDGCKNYTVFSEADRAQGNTLLKQKKCDQWHLAPGWHRFQGAAGDQMLDRCVPVYRCGTYAPGWLNGSHPTVAEDVVTRRVCYGGSKSCCAWSNYIKVKNCSSFYVYELQRTPACNLRYCGNGGEADGCKNYTVLSEADRAQGNKLQKEWKCDQWHLAPGWYRFQGDAGDQMLDRCVPVERCGTVNPGWLSDAHPTVAEGVVTRKVCYGGPKSCCAWSNNIKVKNCSSFYVYELQRTTACNLRYCGNGGKVNECDSYRNIIELDRAQGYQLQNFNWRCDWDMAPGWYRFQGAAGHQIADECVPSRRCGTYAPGWLSGAHPTVAEGVVTRKVCYRGSNGCCQWSNDIKVKNCGSYYVYELQRTPVCSRYCGNAGTEDGCKKYKVLSEPERAQGNAEQNNSRCGDFYLAPGWYRFQGAAGDQIADKCVPMWRCGTQSPGWLSGAHPTVAEGVVTRKVCYHWSKICCRLSNIVKVKNCSSYYVYELQKTPACYLRYCGNASGATTSSPSSSITTVLKEVERKFMSTLGTIDAQQSTSLQEAVSLFKNTTEQYKKMLIQQVQLNATAEQEQRESFFQTAVAFEKFVLNYSNYHINESRPQINIVSSSLVLRIQQGFPQNTSDFLLEGPGRQYSIKVPSRNFENNETVVVGIVYKDFHELLITNYSESDGTDNTRRLNTIIMAVTMDPKPNKSLENVALKFRHLTVADGKRFCVFWNGFKSEKSPDGWFGEGCHAKSTSNEKETECSCNHMTHFAVLFDYSDSLEITKTDEKILRILTYVGLALSITGETLTMILYVLLTDVHQPLSQIRMSLAGSLGAGQIIFLVGINATKNPGACVTVAALVQYFLMTAFCWMLVEGIYFYLFVVKVYNINNKMKIYHLMSWGIPAVMVAMSLGIAAGKDGIQSFVDDEYCWISSDNNLIWIFVAFVVVIETVNLLILARVVKEMNTMQPTEDNFSHQIRHGIKACAVMSPLLGITWLFGLLSPLHKAFVYIFTVLNSIQGFLIFLLHCARNSQIRDRFKRRLNVVFPAASDGNPARKTSKVNQSDAGVVGTIEVQPYNSVFELK